MKKQFLSTLLAFLFFSVAMKSDAQWNLTGNADATSASILGTTNSIPLSLVTKNTKRLVIDTLGRVGIGTATPVNLLTVKGAGSTPAALWANAGAPLFVGFGEQASGNADYILAMASTLANSRPVFIGRRAKGTLAAPLAVASNDYIMSFLSSGYDGTAFQNNAAIDFYVDGTPSAGNVPARISFVTGSNGTNRAERLKIGNTGDITMNTNQFFLQKSNGNIGIGNSAPDAKLHVSGGGLHIDGKQLTHPQGTWLEWNKIGGTGKTYLLNQKGLGGGGFAIGEISNADSISERFSISGSGNVGIGNVNPTAKLDVAGTVKIADGSQGAGKVLTSDANGLASWQTLAGNTWTVNGNNVSNSNTGNVGIGTATPLEKLDIAGNLNFATASVPVGITNEVGGNTPLLNFGVNFRGSGVNLANRAGAYRVDSRVGFPTHNWITRNAGAASINDEKVMMALSENAGLALGTAYTASTPPQDGAIIQGNVGIGNTAPTAKLDVAGTIKIADGSQGAGKVLTSDANGLASWQTLTGGGGTGPWTVNGNNAYNSNTGNIGIGSNTPAAKLQVSGGGFLADGKQSTHSQGAWLEWNKETGQGRTYLLNQKGGGPGGFVIGEVSTADVITERLTITPSGKVGIGTSTPTEPLTVSGAFGISQFATGIKNTTDGGWGLLIQAGLSGAGSYAYPLIGFNRPDGTNIGNVFQDNSNSVLYASTSDERLKTNIANTKFGISDLNKIKIKDYIYKGDQTGKPQTGFIAQQLYTVFPNAVVKGGEDAKTNPWMVDYGRIAPLIVKSVQDLSKENELLKVQTAEQEARIAKLETLVQQLINSKSNAATCPPLAGK